MPIPLIAIAIGVVGAALAGVVVYFWPSIMGWAREHLLPWVDRNMPEFAELVRLGFERIDGVVVAVRKKIRSAWRKLRTVLLAETAEFVRLFNNEWAVRITSYLNKSEQGERPVVRVVTEQRLAWDELPDHIRSQAIANGLDRQRIDVVGMQDQMLSEST